MSPGCIRRESRAATLSSRDRRRARNRGEIGRACPRPGDSASPIFCESLATGDAWQLTLESGSLADPAGSRETFAGMRIPCPSESRDDRDKVRPAVVGRALLAAA
jgi:hypothetical protein